VCTLRLACAAFPSEGDRDASAGYYDGSIVRQRVVNGAWWRDKKFNFFAPNVADPFRSPVTQRMPDIIVMNVGAHDMLRADDAAFRVTRELM
jgi:hypothetical protein